MGDRTQGFLRPLHIRHPDLDIMTRTSSSPSSPDARADRIDWRATIPFALAHLACFAAIWTGVHLEDALVGLALFWARMFGVTAGYHRYFSHRAYRTGRVFQFLLALLAQSSAQRGVLWWAAHHRDHHRHSDTDADPHSPVRRGFWRAHLGWIFEPRHEPTKLDRIPDFAKYPELVWLDRHPYLPAVALGFATWAAGGWSMLVVGFFWSTVALWHATFAINSLAHVIGCRRYVTGDDSRNNWWLALLTMGEGWHNNHHYYQSSVRQGFRWYELDLSYLILRLLRGLRIVGGFRLPPKAVVENRRRLKTATVERAAEELLARLRVEERIAELRAALEQARRSCGERAEGMGAAMANARQRGGERLGEAARQVQRRMDDALHGMQDRLADWRLRLEAMIGDAEAPRRLPTRDELMARARALYRDTPSLDDIVARAEAKLLARLEELFEGLRPSAVFGASAAAASGVTGGGDGGAPAA